MVEHVRYMTPRKNKNETRVVAEINRGAIGPGESDMWEGVVMRVPAVPPTNLAGMYLLDRLQCWTIATFFTFHRSRMFGPKKLRPSAVDRSRSRRIKTFKNIS